MSSRSIYLIVISFGVFLMNALTYGIDVNMVKLAGDGSKYGMKIEKVDVGENSFRVETTGAIFEFDGIAKKMTVSQRIGVQRKLMEVSVEFEPTSLRVRESDKDHVLISTDSYNFGIYGDSMCLFQSLRQNLALNFTGDFKPDYSHTAMDEWLFMDESGGVGVFPQWYDTGFKMTGCKPDQKNWTLGYTLKSGQRMLIFAFPARPFDEEKAIMTQTIFSVGYPPNDVIESWSKYGNVLVLMHGTGGSPFYGGEYRWLGVDEWWECRTPGAWEWGGPWVVNNEKEMQRVVKKAHDVGMKVTIYTTPFFHYARPDADAYMADVKKAKEAYDIDGVYVDGLYWQAKYRNGKEAQIDEIKSLEVMRRLREFFGPEGIIYFHGSAHGTMDRDMVFPTLDSYSDYVLYGENYDFNKYKAGKKIRVEDHPHVKYIIRKKNVSNSIGMLKCLINTNQARPEWKTSDVIDAMWKIDCRMRWGTYPVKGVYPKEPDAEMKPYFEKLKKMQKEYQKKNK